MDLPKSKHLKGLVKVINTRSPPPRRWTENVGSRNSDFCFCQFSADRLWIIIGLEESSPNKAWMGIAAALGISAPHPT